MDKVPPSLFYENLMQRCINLAKQGSGYTAPNPLVGAVLVQGETILAEGFHARYGGPHAEVEALQALDRVPQDALLVVNLEPCSHHGKTPPCVDMLIAKGVRSIVVGCKDIAPHVHGSGIAKLRAAGVKIIENVLAEQAQFLNRRFFTFHALGRPYIILKWAQTSDGFMARNDGSSKWISGKDSRLLVHQWRAEESAVLVGKRTLLRDDPYLTVRSVPGKNPLRIVFDPDLSASSHSHIFNQDAPTWVLNSRLTEDRGHVQLFSPAPQETYIDLLMRLCREEKILSLFVEGGAATLSSFLSSNLWDEARIFSSNKITFGSGLSSPELHELHEEGVKKTGEVLSEDTLKTLFNTHFPSIIF
jgi:diaminohydroxyphosphoribosylaminopyrimidine deaminase / 5-amino-6-(5-phosphoribosylamino)uracil reductase